MYLATGEAGLATVPIFSSAPSLTVNVYGSAGTLPADFVFRVLLRGGSTPSPSDVACELRATPTQLSIALTGAVTVESTIGPPMDPMSAGGFGVQVRMQPTLSGNNVMCLLGYDTSTMWVEQHIDFPPGTFGFAVTLGDAYVYMLEIFDRDNAQPFPF